MRRLHRWALVLLVGITAACSDQLVTPASPPLILDPAKTVVPQGSLDEEIALLSDAVFPRGLETAAGTRWESVKAKYAEGQGDAAQMKVAHRMLYELARWVQGKTSQMDTPPNGESREAAAARLVTYMAMYVHSGPDTEVPPYNPEADAVVGFITPTEPATITTPAGYAGIGVDAGSVTEPAIVTVTQNAQEFPGNCNGPLQTRRCQYPLFYDFHIYPEQKLLRPAHGAVCHVAPTSARRPLDDPEDVEETVHERLRLAHTLPADPDNYTDGATQYGTDGENIEILPLSAAVGSSGVDCSEAPAYSFGPLGRALNAVASVIGRSLTPEPLYAVDQGPEHDFSFFSPFNLVDPVGTPDLSVESLGIELAEQPVYVNDVPNYPAVVGFTAVNRSPVNGGSATATSGAASAAVYLSADAIRDDADALIGSAVVPALVPDSSLSLTVNVLVPAQQSAAVYVLVELTPAAMLPDADAANDAAAVMVELPGEQPDGPAITSLALSTTTLTVGGAQGAFTATIVNPGDPLSPVTLQGWIEQGATRRASGGTLIGCGESPLGTLPSGTCQDSFSVGADDTNSAGTGQFISGSATFVLELLQSTESGQVVLDSRTIPVTLVVTQ